MKYVPLRKYEIERKLGEMNRKLVELTDEMEIRRNVVAGIRMSIQETTKEKQIRKYEEEAQKAEALLNETQAEIQRSELQLNQLLREQEQNIVYPTCAGCKKSGNIFVFQAVATETTLKEHQLSENIPTVGTGIVYCIKCGHIVGTANREKLK